MINLETAKRLSSYGNGLYGNAIINGNFDIWQRGTSFTTSGYTTDRWYFYEGSSNTAIISRSSFTVGQTDVPNNPTYYLSFTRTSTANNTDFLQPIEDVNSFSNGKLSLSFYAKGTAGKVLTIYPEQEFGTGGSANVAITSQNVTLTTSWIKYELVFDIPNISGKTIGTNSSLWILFRAGSGNGNMDFDLSQVVVNAGSEPLPFCPRSYGEELALCQRYYQRWQNSSGYSPHISMGQNYSTTAARTLVCLSVPMRGTPTVTTSGELRVFGNGGNQKIVSSVGSASDASGGTCKIDVAFASGLTDGGACMFFCSASGSWFALDCEL